MDFIRRITHAQRFLPPIPAGTGLRGLVPVRGTAGMRPDGRQEGLRQAMSWAHTWSGLLLGWLLFAVFLTGTLSYVRDEITVWMKPELHASVADAGTAQRALAAMERIAPRAESWNLVLPGPREPAVSATWREPGAAPGRAGLSRALFDAGTGEPIAARQTRGGDFLYRFHFELYGVPRIWARWLVGIATLCMLAAIVSGVITHKKIFADFFTFRPGKGQRSWLDAHNATAVLALPFHFMITFSGLLLLMFQLMPWGIQAAYQGDVQAYFQERRGGAQAQQRAPQARAPGQEAAPAPAGGPEMRGQGGRGDGQGRQGVPDGGMAREGRQRPGDAAAAPIPAAAMPVAAMLVHASSQWGGAAVEGVTVNRPRGRPATVELRERGSSSLAGRGASRRLLFDAASGQPLPGPDAAAPGAAAAVYNVFTSLHLGRFAGPALRWLLFLSGVAGTLMVATGLVLWVAKRLPDRRKLGRTPAGHRLVERLNVAAVAGLMVAVAAYFWLNRLLPAGLAGRADWEIRGFFLAWAACLAHAWACPHRRAWVGQLGLAAALWAALPLLNGLTGGAALPGSMARGLWSVAGFDLCALATAALLAYAAWRTGRAAPAGKAAGRTPAGTAPGPGTAAARQAPARPSPVAAEPVAARAMAGEEART